jgi:aromatic-L-amino-acid decarboxylase
MKGITHWNHPKFMAYFNSTSSGPGILAELVSASLNVNGMLWKTSPSATELEEVTLNWFREMLQLPPDFWGIIYDTASVSTMHAVAAARENISSLNIRELGMSGRRDLPQLRLYTSEHSHSSIEKAAVTLGIGLDGVRKIPVDENFKMIPSELAKAIEEDKVAGILPFCAVATVGTTSTTSIDPVDEIADICRKENIWLHVDAAYGGTAALLPEMRCILNGIEKADSIVVNPHKWMFTPIDLSIFFTNKPDVLKQAFSIVPEYLKTSEDSVVKNYMDYGVQLGRRFRSLKLWFIIRYFGTEGIRERIRNHIRMSGEFAEWVDNNPVLERCAPAPLSTVCFRAKPEGIEDEDKLNALNEKLMNSINSTGSLFLTHTKLNGKFVIRLVIASIRMSDRHVEEARQIITDKLTEILDR